MLKESIYYAHTNNLIARKELFEQVGYFDERPRGADVIFIHRVLARYGTDAVRYEPSAMVTHMEVDSARVYLKKCFLYGRSAHLYAEVVSARPLRTMQRIRIYRETVQSSRLPPLEASLLLALLVIGVGFYQLGWLSVLPPRLGLVSPNERREARP
jgi:hypothetical protein